MADGSKVLSLAALAAWALFALAVWSTITGQPWVREAWGAAWVAFATGMPVAWLVNVRKFHREMGAALEEARRVVREARNAEQA